MKLESLNAMILAAAATVTSLGCASVAVPNTRLASSEAAARSAHEVGAESVPQASLHLKFSDEQIATAKKLIASGDNEKADLTLQEAEADAELALALTRESKAAAEAQAAQVKVAQARGGK